MSVIGPVSGPVGWRGDERATDDGCAAEGGQMTIDETERDATSTGGEMSADERVVAVMARRKRGDAAKKATGSMV